MRHEAVYRSQRQNYFKLIFNGNLYINLNVTNDISTHRI
jgi:hypothetical protein